MCVSFIAYTLTHGVINFFIVTVGGRNRMCAEAFAKSGGKRFSLLQNSDPILFLSEIDF